MGTYQGSDLIVALEWAWAQIREHHPDVPEVVMITGSGAAGSEWGHCHPDRWARGEIGADLDPEAAPVRRRGPLLTELRVTGERLACGARLTFQTLLHEAAHALAAVRSIQDTSRQGRWHNRRFQALGQELGLAWPAGQAADPTIGYSAMEIPDDTAKRYAPQIERLGKEIRLALPLPYHMAPASIPGEDPPALILPPVIPRAPRAGQSRSRWLLAQCPCPRKIRVSRTTVEEGPVVCGLCQDPFTLKEEESNDD